MHAEILTYKILKELLSYDAETGVFIWLVNKGSVKAGDIAGYPNGLGYTAIQVNGKPYQAHRLAWLYITGGFPKNQIDHINHIKNDNRRENLRCATNAENSRNKTIYKNNGSGICGVSWVKRDKKWQVMISVNNKQIGLGYFGNLFDAVCARKSAELKLGYHRNHGQLNKHKEKES